MSRTAPKLVDAGELARQQLLAGLDVADETFDLAAIPTAILETGDGPPLVLLHGPGEFKERWLRVLPGLSRTHRVIAPDFPGHGRSGTHPDGLDADRVFAWIDALLDDHCRDRPVLTSSTGPRTTLRWNNRSRSLQQSSRVTTRAEPGVAALGRNDAGLRWLSSRRPAGTPQSYRL